jgi:DNA-binding beta-propeller fold protein YncE
MGRPATASAAAIVPGTTGDKLLSSPTFYTIAGLRFTGIRRGAAIGVVGPAVKTGNAGSAARDFPFTMNFSRVRNLGMCFGERMKLFRMAGLAAGLMMVLVWTGCGDTYRPVATPIAPVTGSPEAQRVALLVYAASPSCITTKTSTTCTCPDGTSASASTSPCPKSPGSTTQIDVSGDDDMADVKIGDISPVFSPDSGITQTYAIFATEGIYVANNNDNDLFQFPTFSPGATSTIISLPPSSQPVAMAEVIDSSTIYVANYAQNNVSVISETTNAATTATPLLVGNSPVALAVNKSGTKVYVANYAADKNGNFDVSVISTVDNAVDATAGGPITVGNKPVSITSNSLGSEMYVLNQGDPQSQPVTLPTISAIDPFLDAVICSTGSSCKTSVTLSSSTDTAISPNYMVFDPSLQRLYVGDPVAGQIWVFDASQTGTPGLPVLITVIPVGAQPGAFVVLSDGSRLGGQPGAFAVLPDGSRVYVANMTPGASCQVQVISSTTNNVMSGSSGCISLTEGTPTWIAVSGDGSKVYVTETNGTSIIRTSDNTVIKTVAAPANMTPVYVISE